MQDMMIQNPINEIIQSILNEQNLEPNAIIQISEKYIDNLSKRK